MENVFVYGSLKTGLDNNPTLRNSEFLGLYATDPEFTMLDLGAFPGVIGGGKTSIVGELFRVNDDIMRDLDHLEGYPDFYNRIKVETLFGSAWMYVLSDSKDYELNRIVESGEW